jgi:hypothetical protein
VRKQPPPDPVIEYEEPPPGYKVVWTQLPGRRVATEEETKRKCRRPGCRRQPVLALQRSNGWWLYCDWHTYGTKIEDGRALSRVIRPIASPLFRR